MELAATAYKGYSNFVDAVLEEADPRTRDWFMIQNTPIYVWSATLSYLLFVLWLGPRLMKNRKAFDLRWFMIAYNAFLVGLSLYMVVELWYSAFYLNRYHPICQPFSSKTAHLKPTELRVAQVLWWYFFSKVIEFTDTILMVLRKKDSQITFLHVFHHASMLNIWWFCELLIPGGQSWMAPSMNSLVHVVMYAYYLLNMFPSLRKYLWWKRYLTQFQLAQFVLILVHTTNTYVSGCDFPVWSIFMLGGYMLIMIILFSNFYIKSYLSKGKEKSMQNGKTHNGRDSNFNVNIKVE